MKQNYSFPTQAELDAVKLNWKRYLFPAIHPEGIKILGIEFLIILALDLIMTRVLLLPSLWYIGLPLIIFSFYFFRNPDRVSPKGDDLILSPADGIVSNIKSMVPPKELDLGTEPMIRISIFMSVFNVHVNRSPVSGTVTRLHYRPGKFVNISDKDSEDNERQEIAILSKKGPAIGVVQIAGLVARRIYCPLKENDTVTAGKVFGMIRFGSRLDVYLPHGVYPKVLVGQSMIAGETVLADMSTLTTAKKKEA
ncbi:MAG: phosphatidylserine decarboxylase [Alphaproteobacteria bacterium]|nr:phosphatidylserine decarboxylase [Alphaproteobacteria bacterium]